MRLKGRHWVLLWLLIFSAWRRGGGDAPDGRASTRRAGSTSCVRSGGSLEARRAELERRIRVASSRQVLVPMAERTSACTSRPTPSSCSSPFPPRPEASALMAAHGPHRRHPVRLRAGRRSPSWRGRRSSSWCRATAGLSEAERQRTERTVLPARRGALYDRNGVPLAVSQEFYHVGVAPNELVDARAASSC